MTNWNRKVKRLLKTELVKRGITNAELAARLQAIGIKETKSSIDSKISRGTFSASFFIQCLTVINCPSIELEQEEIKRILSKKTTPQLEYQKAK